MELVMPKSALTRSRAGAIMVEETGEMNVKQDTMMVAVHLRATDQFRGFVGSDGDDQVTCEQQKLAEKNEQEKRTNGASHQVRIFLLIPLFRILFRFQDVWPCGGQRVGSGYAKRHVKNTTQ